MQSFADIKDYTQNPFNEHQNNNHKVYTRTLIIKQTFKTSMMSIDMLLTQMEIGSCPALFDKITPNPTQIE
jgi:hypothetical protein